jgi:tyrosyl-tRNA synthetase
VARKIRKAVAAPRVTEENGLLAFAEFVLLPAAALQRRQFAIDRSRDGQEPLIYSDIEKMREDYKNDMVCLSISRLRCFNGKLIHCQLTPQLLKSGVTQALNDLLAPIQAKYQGSKEWQEVTLKAYPPAEKPKKEKKVKKSGPSNPIQKDLTLADRTKTEESAG